MILGLDVSTVTWGYCILNDDNTINKLSYHKVVAEEMLDKGIELRSFIDTLIKDNPGITKVCLEDRLQAFAGGATSAAAIIKLSALNYLCQYLFWEKTIKVVTINVNTARKLWHPQFHSIARKIKGTKQKELVFELVIKELGSSLFPTKIMKSGARKGETVFIEEARDMADAYVISVAGSKK